MGVVKHATTGARVTLANQSLVGRTAACRVRVSSRRASTAHAMILWDGTRWWARDLGSTNGTLHNGERVRAGERVGLGKGSELQFGDTLERWILEDISSPETRATHTETGDVRVAADGLLALPDTANLEVTLYEDSDGRWLMERAGMLSVVRDQETITLRDGTWRLEVCPTVQYEHVPTTQQLDAAACVVRGVLIRFHVSLDHEHIEVDVVSARGVSTLGNRAHNEVLLHLARARLRDAQSDLPEAERGWLYVDDVLEAMKLDLQHFNVHVFRARQQFAQARVLDAGALFERRASTHQIRLATSAIEILGARETGPTTRSKTPGAL